MAYEQKEQFGIHETSQCYEVVLTNPITIDRHHLKLDESKVEIDGDKVTIPAGTTVIARVYTPGQVVLFQQKDDMFSILNTAESGVHFNWTSEKNPQREITQKRRAQKRHFGNKM